LCLNFFCKPYLIDIIPSSSSLSRSSSSTQWRTFWRCVGLSPKFCRAAKSRRALSEANQQPASSHLDLNFCSSSVIVLGMYNCEMNVCAWVQLNKIFNYFICQVHVDKPHRMPQKSNTFSTAISARLSNKLFCANFQVGSFRIFPIGLIA